MTIRPRDRIALGAVAAVAAIAAIYLLVLAPARTQASNLTSQIAGQRSALVQAQTKYAQGNAARAALRAHAADWAALRRAVPDTSDIPALLRVLERNAAAVHVKMQAIQLSGSGSGTSAPSAAAPTTGSTTPTAGASTTTTGASPAATTSSATTVPVSLTFAGSYRDLDSLVRRLDGLVAVTGKRIHAAGPLLSISNVSLSQAQTGSSSAGLTVQLTASIYQLAPTAGTAGTATGGTS